MKLNLKQKEYIGITIFSMIVVFAFLYPSFIDDKKDSGPKEIASDISYKFYPLAGFQIGNAKKEMIATIPCQIVSITTDSVVLNAMNSYTPWVASITLVKPTKFLMNVGDKANVIATQWSGGYEVGWVFKIE